VAPLHSSGQWDGPGINIRWMGNRSSPAPIARALVRLMRLR
jgi:hypothetical protein